MKSHEVPKIPWRLMQSHKVQRDPMKSHSPEIPCNPSGAPETQTSFSSIPEKSQLELSDFKIEVLVLNFCIIIDAWSDSHFQYSSQFNDS